MSEIRLGDVCNVGAGQSAPNKDTFSTNGIPFIRAGSLETLSEGTPENALEKLTPEAAAQNGLKLYPADTVVFAKSGMSANIGRIYKLKNPCYVVSHLATLVTTNQYNATYLMYSR